MWAHATFLPTGRGNTELICPLNPTFPEKSFLISVIHTDLPFCAMDSDCFAYVCLVSVGKPGCRLQKSTARIQMWAKVSGHQEENRWWTGSPGLRKRKNEAVQSGCSGCQSRWPVESLGRQKYLQELGRYLRWRQERSRAQQAREVEERVPRAGTPKLGLIPGQRPSFTIILPAIV